MKKAPLPSNEEQRLAVLEKFKILDTLHEKVFDDLVLLASSICETPIALISLLDESRQWFKARVGLDAQETPREISFCGHAILQDGLFCVPDAALDPRFSDNPLVAGDPKIRFYAGVPLVSTEGMKLGTLCVIDRVSRQLTPFQEATLATLARQIEANFELRRQGLHIKEYQETITNQYQALKTLEKNREELISLIIHDLKSPLAAIKSANEILMDSLDPSVDLYEMTVGIGKSVEAMSRIVMDVLDANTSQSGVIQPRISEFDLKSQVAQLLGRVKSRAFKNGQQVSLLVFGTDEPIESDEGLILRIIENLVDNALKYTSGIGKRIEIGLDFRSHDTVEIHVKDQGIGISPQDRERVFEKQVRLEAHARVHDTNSRGLGLAFCRLATEELGGIIWVEDNAPCGSVFCVRIPKADKAKRNSKAA